MAVIGSRARSARLILPPDGSVTLADKIGQDHLSPYYLFEDGRGSVAVDNPADVEANDLVIHTLDPG